MIPFLKSRLGMGCTVAFVLLMAFALHRVAARRAVRAAPNPILAVTAPPGAPASAVDKDGAPLLVAPTAAPARPAGWSGAVENAAYLDAYAGLTRAAREDQDSRGNRVLRRRTARVAESVAPAPVDEPVATTAVKRASLRLTGRDGPSPGPGEPRAVPAVPGDESGPPPQALAPLKSQERKAPHRFNPYGRVIKCELVFTIDSANEQTPLVGLVIEPVYNNGVLVIPAGAELHGVARPDRVRDRLFSGTEWVLVFPREGGRPNGRQLNVRGVALQREDPRGTGLSWGLTDGSYGLAGRVIRSHDQADIKRFLATFLAAGAVTLQERESRGRGTASSIRSTPQNAALQGVAVNLERYAEAIAAEIEAHGVFIRVPAGHQFYFYPTQIIDAETAGVSADIATVK